MGSTILLILHLKPISYLASVAREPSFSNSQYPGQIIELVAKAGAAIIVLLIITTISVYKPWGRIQLALPGNDPLISKHKVQTNRQWKFYALLGIIFLLVVLIIKHLFGGGMQGH